MEHACLHRVDGAVDDFGNLGARMPEVVRQLDHEPLLERGMLPGCRICPVRLSPFGDPIVDVEGTMLALRKETAGCLCVRLALAVDAA
jgi:hypothetical protein